MSIDFSDSSSIIDLMSASETDTAPPPPHRFATTTRSNSMSSDESDTDAPPPRRQQLVVSESDTDTDLSAPPNTPPACRRPAAMTTPPPPLQLSAPPRLRRQSAHVLFAESDTEDEGEVPPTTPPTMPPAVPPAVPDAVPDAVHEQGVSDAETDGFDADSESGEDDAAAAPTSCPYTASLLTRFRVAHFHGERAHVGRRRYWSRSRTIAVHAGSSAPARGAAYPRTRSEVKAAARKTLLLDLYKRKRTRAVTKRIRDLQGK